MKPGAQKSVAMPERLASGLPKHDVDEIRTGQSVVSRSPEHPTPDDPPGLTAFPQLRALRAQSQT
jgi:hypothetical protein